MTAFVKQQGCEIASLNVGTTITVPRVCYKSLRANILHTTLDWVARILIDFNVGLLVVIQRAPGPRTAQEC